MSFHKSTYKIQGTSLGFLLTHTYIGHRRGEPKAHLSIFSPVGKFLGALPEPALLVVPLPLWWHLPPVLVIEVYCKSCLQHSLIFA